MGLDFSSMFNLSRINKIPSRMYNRNSKIVQSFMFRCLEMTL